VAGAVVEAVVAAELVPVLAGVLVLELDELLPQAPRASADRVAAMANGRWRFTAANLAGIDKLR
jgi:hypothetical protein